MLILAYHVFILSLYIYSIWFDSNFVHMPFPSKEFENLPLRARPIFLTFWTVVIQTLYFSVAILNDVFGTNAATKRPPLIRKVRDHLYSLAFTTALYVVTIFWTLYNIDKTFIYPDEETEKHIPTWLNHVMHTLIFPIILLELLISNRNYPRRKTGLTIALCSAAAYSAYIHYLYFKYGIWPYNFLHIFSWTSKIVMTLFSAVLGVMYYILGEKLDSLMSKSTKAHKHANGLKSH